MSADLVVVVVAAVVFGLLFAYLWRLDRRVRNLERK
jgi:CcmD family protein